MEENEKEIPEGTKRIYHAKIEIEIKRFRYKKHYKEKLIIKDVYVDGSEKNPNSFLMTRIKKMCNLKVKKATKTYKPKASDAEEFKIVSIDKIKYLGNTIPKAE